MVTNYVTFDLVIWEKKEVPLEFLEWSGVGLLDEKNKKKDPLLTLDNVIETRRFDPVVSVEG